MAKKNKRITKEVLNTIERLTRLGHTQYFISDVLGISTTTLSRWKFEDPEVANALNVSTEGLLQDVKSRLLGIALNGEADSDRINAGKFLLNRYDTTSETTEASTSTDDDIKHKILIELKG